MLSKYFSPELTNAQLERDCPEGELCGLDFDPILGAQDFDDHLNFQLHTTEATPPQTGRFEARFKLFNEDKQEQVVVFQLVQLKNGWRIDDIIYPNDNASLKAVITALVNESLHLKEMKVRLISSIAVACFVVYSWQWLAAEEEIKYPSQP